MRAPDYVFVDPDSGVTLSFFLSDGTSESERDLPYVESLHFMDGEGCLHAEGECDACDQLRNLYRDGEIAELHRVTLSPAVECDGTFRLSVPLVADSGTCELYRCFGGTLETTQRTLSSDDQGVAKVYLSGDGAGIQSPFGIAYGWSDTEGSPALKIDVHARIPPDDDEPEDEELEEEADEEEGIGEEEGLDEESSAEKHSSIPQESEAGSFPTIMCLVAAVVLLRFWAGHKRS